MPSLFQLPEDIVIRLRAKGVALDDEKAHYASVKGMSPDDRSVVQYLYDRLNIIDNKASSILTVNTISLSVSSVVLASGTGGTAFVRSQPPEVFVLAAIAVAVSIVAIFLTLAITRVKFDHITPTRTFDEYRLEFFRITIARQWILAAARMFTGLAFLFYAVLLGWALFRARGW